jgi:elongation factor P--beta-lysine ligase
LSACAVPLNEDFLSALAYMSSAPGFNCLVMLATGACTIDDVPWTPAPD